MTAGLLNPLPGRVVTQPFGGSYVAEPPAYLSSDHYRARDTPFGTAPLLPHVAKHVDIAAPLRTQIVAPEHMIIRIDGYDDVRGRWCYGEIRPGTVLEFDHLDDVLVEPGTIVLRGAIGWAVTGDSGIATAPILAFGVLHSGGSAPSYRLAHTWMHYNPTMLLVGGSHAGEPWILPL